MTEKYHLKDYGAVPIVTADASTSIDPNISWVQAHVIQQKEEIEQLNNSSGGNAAASDVHPPGEYRDWPFALFFYIHLIIMGFMAIFYGSFDFDAGDVNSQTSASASDGGSSTVVILIAVVVILSMAIPYILISTIIPMYPTPSITFSLIASVVMNCTFCLMLFMSIPNIWTFLLSVAIIIWSIWYVSAIRVFIPFSSAVLKLAARGVGVNGGLYLVSFALSLVGVFWLGVWVYIVNGLGVVEDLDDGSNKGGGYYYYDYTTEKAVGVMFALSVSLYWSINILVNISQTTVAGVIGTYSFDKPSASSFCSTAIFQSLRRSLTTSFGSICFGSLLDALIMALRAMADQARANARQDDDGCMTLLYCVAQCILSILQDIIEYFNQWCYTFVGIYGMSYLESGKAVLELFKARGCTAILTDGLTTYVLNCVVLGTGLICGLVAAVIAGSGALGIGAGAAFWLSFFVGVIISSAMANAVQGAVKAVLVCYVDHPAKLHENHPLETRELSAAIALVFPEVPEFSFDTTVV